MDTEMDWQVLAGNGHCVPMPRTTTEISDRFTSVWAGAPDFVSLQRAATYPLTLEMMFGVLRAAVAGVAARGKSEEANASYQASMSALDLALEHYRSGNAARGSLQVQLAQHLFRWGALPQSRAIATKYVEAIRQRLSEPAETPVTPDAIRE